MMFERTPWFTLSLNEYKQKWNHQDFVVFLSNNNLEYTYRALSAYKGILEIFNDTSEEVFNVTLHRYNGE